MSASFNLRRQLCSGAGLCALPAHGVAVRAQGVRGGASPDDDFSIYTVE